MGDAQTVDSVIIEWTSGLTESFSIPGVNQFFTAEEGTGSVITSVESNKRNTTAPTYVLSQNYPNPFNPETIINYQLTTRLPARQVNNFVSIKVYDVLGNEVASLVNEEKPAGSYSVKFDGSNLSSGIYFYKLQVIDPESSSGQGFVQTKKMILLK